MLKDLVKYTDIEGKPASMTVFFNLTQFEVEMEMELEVIQARFQRFMDEIVGPDGAPLREMTGPEKREIFGMIKTIMKHAYGIKRDLNFDKDDPPGSGRIWQNFEASGAFSAYVYQLFATESGEPVNRFMAGIWPQGVARQTPDGSALATVTPIAPDDGKGGTQVAPDDVGWEFMNSLEEYTDDYLEKSSDSEFDAIANHFSEGKNVPFRLLSIGTKRRTKTE